MRTRVRASKKRGFAANPHPRVASIARVVLHLTQCFGTSFLQ